MYIVRCEHPGSADVIPRGGPVESRHETLHQAMECLFSWYVGGPNGPARSATLHNERGERLDARDEAARIGVELMGRRPCGGPEGSWYPCGTRPAA